MLEAIRKIGEYSFKKEGLDPSKKDDLIKILCEPLSQKNCLIIDFVSSNGKFKFDKVDHTENQDPTGVKYLYKSGPSSKGPNYSPTYITNKEINKKFDNRLIGWFKKVDRSFPEEIINLSESFTSSQETILKNLQEKWNDISSPDVKSCIVTLRINGKDMIDIDFFRDNLIDKVTTKLKEISKDRAVCSLSGEEGRVYSYAFPYSFYTLDKPGFRTAGFRQEDGWKAFPYSYSTYLKIEKGKKYIDEYLSSRLAGINFMLVPVVTMDKDELFSKMFETIEQMHKKILKVEDLKIVNQGEAYIKFLAERFNDNLSLNLIFYEMQQAKYIIHLLLQEVYPSRLSKIYQCANEVEKFSIFKNIQINKTKFEDISFNLLFLRNVLTRTNKEIKPFLEVLEKIVKGRRIDYDYIISKIMIQFRSRFLEETLSRRYVLESLLNLLFIDKLNLFKNKISEVKMTSNDENVKKTEGWFDLYRGTYPTPAHRAVFLLGALTQRLLNIQGYSRPPFKSKLKGLRMKESDIISLLPKIRNKLEEYDSHYYKKMESVASHYLNSAGRNWGLSINEINYLFVLGMNLYNVKDEKGNEIFRFGEKEEEEVKNE